LCVVAAAAGDVVGADGPAARPDADAVRVAVPGCLVIEAGAGVASEACASRYFSRQDSVTNWLPYLVSICWIVSEE